MINISNILSEIEEKIEKIITDLNNKTDINNIINQLLDISTKIK